MRITRIETVRIGAQPRIIWVQVHTDAGIVGLGETYYAPTVVQAAVHDHFGAFWGFRLGLFRPAIAFTQHKRARHSWPDR